MTGCLLAALLLPPIPVTELRVSPAAVRLDGPGARYSLLVDGRTAAGPWRDLTGAAGYRSLNPAVANVDAAGVVRVMGDGTTAIEVQAGGRALSVPVTVTGSGRPRAFHFENDVVPLLSRYGCNASGCHGKAEGQNGFKLSVFGFDPRADHAALLMEGRGRRVFPASPERSLLLTKAAGLVPHGGGARLARTSQDFATLRAWIAAGAPFGAAEAPRVAALRLEPAERELAMRGRQQLRVIARFSDGRETDVTHHARFQSNNDGLAAVSPDGLVTAGEAPGDVAIMASYLDQVAVFRALVPRPPPVVAFPDLPPHNFIDALVFRKLRRLNVPPSGPADDATFLRRVYLDVIGTLPTAAEARRFLADPRPDRRARLVDELLARPEFADYWALLWADVLRVDRQALGHKKALAYYQWIRGRLAANAPLDQFARELVTAEGPTEEPGPAAFYPAVGKPGDLAGTVAQVFLGVRIACAECHHHPFDRWAQDDYYGLRAYFEPIRVGKSAAGGLVTSAGQPAAKNPRTGVLIAAHALGQPMPAQPPTGDPRPALADWLTAPDNPWFARNLANRVWAHFLGRGLVEPVDDVRATNPPSNPELLDALARCLVEGKYDLRHLIRTITASHTYQLGTAPVPGNERDEQNYSRARFKRLPAEVLLDMVCQATGVPEKFDGVPAGARAIQLWDSKVNHYFLKVFGRPVRATACECERNAEPSVAQVLHLLNAPEVQAKLAHEGGRVAGLVRAIADDGRLAEELYLACYARLPTAEEKRIAVAHLAKNPARRRPAAEDLAWALLNTLEFAFNH